ncbi:MAG: fibronectin type III domain-containing protein [Gulosibacter sp.]|uniref:fibronectin type III domain-containing protein n=1 Tax=Gulosibacter sp. TaxID=2817531 RepID=UPI003F8E3B94
MNRSIRKRATITAAAVIASAALFIPTASFAAVAPTVVETETNPVSHLGLNPGANETQLNFNWFTSSATAEQVQIAPASAQTGEEFPATEAVIFDAEMTADNDQGLTTAKATATGLEANTEYIYRVGSEEGGWSQTYTYSTEGFGGDFNFNFFGDAQIGSGSSSKLGEGGGLEQDAQGWYETLDASVEMYPDASFLFSAGDQIDGYGDDGDLESLLGDRDPQYDLFFAEGADVLREVPLATLSGNHDDEGWTYDEYFNMPNADDRSYWYEHNGALVIGLDINTISIYDYFELGQLETDEERAEFLAGLRPQIEAGIDRATEYTESIIAQQGDDADWIIVGFHQSPFSQANHYYDPDIEIMREGFTQSLSDAGVNLVLGGHDHIYTRTHLMEGSTPVVPDAPAGPGDVLTQEDGQVLYLTGSSSSGSKFYDFMDTNGVDDPELVDYDLTHDSTAMWSQDYTADFSNIAITEDSLTVKVHNTHDGSLVDSVELRKPDADNGSDDDDANGSEDAGAQGDDDANGDDNGSGTAEPSSTPTATEDNGANGAGGTDGNDGDDNGAGDAKGDDNLAQTGASDMIMVGAAALALLAGGATIYFIRRQQA